MIWARTGEAGRQPFAVNLTVARLGLLVLGALALSVSTRLEGGNLAPLAIYLIAVVAAGGGVWLIARGAERTFLLDLFLVAFVARVVLVAVSQLVLLRAGTGGFVFPDDRAYDEIGWQIARTWNGDQPGILSRDSYLVMNYTYLLGLLYFTFGHSLAAAKVMNAAFGALAALGTYGIARELWGQAPARIAGIVAAAFPSMFVWSLINLKDTMVVMAVALTIWLFLAFSNRHDGRAAAGSLAAFASVNGLRHYLFVILGWLLIVGYPVSSVEPWRIRLRNGLLFAVAAMAVMYWTGTQSFGLQYLTPQKANQFDGWRNDPDAQSRLAVPVQFDDDTNFYERQAIFLPFGVANMLIQPTPFGLTSLKEAALLPDAAFWYVVVVASCLGLYRAARKRKWNVLVPAVYTALVIVALALIENNVFTLVRHRAMVLPTVIALGAPILLGIWLWASRRWRGSSEQVGTLA